MALQLNIKHFTQWALLGVLVVFATTYFSSNIKQKSRSQPSTSPEQLPVISKISPFSLTNHLGQAVTENDLLGSPWLANIIFTRCPTICPQITQTISKLLPKIGRDVKIISLTTDPEFDSPDILNNFAKANQATSTNWFFLTGDKQALVTLAVNNLKMVSLPKEESKRETPTDLFIHSSLIVLVDQNGQVRASFDSGSKDLLPEIQSTLKRINQ
jgi:protein SCO1/2